MAAEQAIDAGIAVDLYDAMGSVGRKFLLAGKGGLNLTHAEPFANFVGRYRERQGEIAHWLHAFDADALRAWARALGVETFVGSSGRVFPVNLKAAPLLRSWVHWLRAGGVAFHMHHRWLGWYSDGALRLATADGERAVQADAVVLALGGMQTRQGECVLSEYGFFQQWFGYECVDAGSVPGKAGADVDLFVLREVLKRNLWPVRARRRSAATSARRLHDT